MVAIYWLIAFVVLVGIEVATTALTTIWFAGGAFAAFLLALFDVAVEVQLSVFVLVSFVLLFMTRPFAMKYINVGTLKTNADGLIGREARVTSEINNDAGTGSAVVGGQEWTARAQSEDAVYPINTKVWIKEIQGVKLIVSTVKED